MAAPCALLLLAACTPHPVGPARSYDKYRGKAVTTAQSALSVAETVRLLAEAAARGHTFGPYTAMSLSEQENAISGLQATFASIQPPEARASELRSSLGHLLTQEVEQVGSLRISARRGQLRSLAQQAAPLEGVSKRLHEFIEANKA